MLSSLWMWSLAFHCWLRKLIDLQSGKESKRCIYFFLERSFFLSSAVGPINGSLSFKSIRLFRKHYRLLLHYLFSLSQHYAASSLLFPCFMTICTLTKYIHIHSVCLSHFLPLPFFYFYPLLAVNPLLLFLLMLPSAPSQFISPFTLISTFPEYTNTHCTS